MADIGLYSLRFALVIAALGVGTGVFAGSTHRGDWTIVSERCVVGVFGFLTVAMFALFWALATNDFQLAYVAQHSASTMTLPFRLAALWGGQAGSLLLWAWILSAYAVCAVAANRGAQFQGSSGSLHVFRRAGRGRRCGLGAGSLRSHRGESVLT